MNGGKPKPRIEPTSASRTSVSTPSPKQRAVYRAVIALILHNGSRDFHKLVPMSAKIIRDEYIDDHHIFPKAFLADLPTPPPTELRDCILNRTLIDQKTNVRIGARAPSDYLAEMADELGEPSLDRLLKSHLLPVGPESPLRQDQFEDFLATRQAAIWKKMQEATAG